MKFCEQCGHSVTPDATFCESCGSRLPGTVTPNAPGASSTTATAVIGSEPTQVLEQTPGRHAQGAASGPAAPTSPQPGLDPLAIPFGAVYHAAPQPAGEMRSTRDLPQPRTIMLALAAGGAGALAAMLLGAVAAASILLTRGSGAETHATDVVSTGVSLASMALGSAISFDSGIGVAALLLPSLFLTAAFVGTVRLVLKRFVLAAIEEWRAAVLVALAAGAGAALVMTIARMAWGGGDIPMTSNSVEPMSLAMAFVVATILSACCAGAPGHLARALPRRVAPAAETAVSLFGAILLWMTVISTVVAVALFVVDLVRPDMGGELATPNGAVTAFWFALPLTIAWLPFRALGVPLTTDLTGGVDDPVTAVLVKGDGVGDGPSAVLLGSGLPWQGGAAALVLLLALVVGLFLAARRWTTGRQLPATTSSTVAAVGVIGFVAGAAVAWFARASVAFPVESTGVSRSYGLVLGWAALVATVVAALLVVASRAFAQSSVEVEEARLDGGSAQASEEGPETESVRRGVGRPLAAAGVAVLGALLLTFLGIASIERYLFFTTSPDEAVSAYAQTVVDRDYARYAVYASGAQATPGVPQSALDKAMSQGSVASIDTDGDWKVGETERTLTVHYSYVAPDGSTQTLSEPVEARADVQTRWGVVRTPSWTVSTHPATLRVEWPSGMAVAVNGVRVDSNKGYAVMPGSYQAVSKRLGFYAAQKRQVSTDSNGSATISADTTVNTSRIEAVGLAAAGRAFNICVNRARGAVSSCYIWSDYDLTLTSGYDSYIYDQQYDTWSWLGSKEFCTATSTTVNSAASATVTVTCPLSVTKLTTQVTTYYFIPNDYNYLTYTGSTEISYTVTLRPDKYGRPVVGSIRS